MRLLNEHAHWKCRPWQTLSSKVTYTWVQMFSEWKKTRASCRDIKRNSSPPSLHEMLMSLGARGQIKPCGKIKKTNCWKILPFMSYYKYLKTLCHLSDRTNMAKITRVNIITRCSERLKEIISTIYFLLVSLRFLLMRLILMIHDAVGKKCWKADTSPFSS